MPEVPQKSFVGRWCIQIMKDGIMGDFEKEMSRRLEGKFDLEWDIDGKGVVCGWCRLTDPEDIFPAAEAVAALQGRVMTISPLNTPSDLAGASLENPPDDASAKKEPIKLVINYHFFFQGINCTVTITLPDKGRTVKSITPVLKSADWHEREMQDLYNISLQGHPNPKRLFLDKDIPFTDHTMIPLSEAMNSASTSTLWEKIMQSDKKGADTDEQL